MGGSRRGDGARRYAGGVQHFDLLCERASDARWRIREAVAMGLLAYGQADPEGVLALMAEFRVLRNGLAYGWSVGVVAYPELGKPRMVRWVAENDADARWIMKRTSVRRGWCAWTQRGFRRSGRSWMVNVKIGVEMKPRIANEWWQVAGDPDLGTYTTPEQQPVDFAVWQAADGTWQLWSCIRHTACGGQTRLFYRWEGADLLAPNWEPMGIAMEARADLGETPGGLQAPHVIKENGIYHMFYGDWQRICLARSEDGKSFERVLVKDGEPALFSGPYGNSRDAMVLKVDGTYYCYYTGHREHATPAAAVFCRTSHDMLVWSDPVIVSAGGWAVGQTDWYGGDCECPHVVERDGQYCLFRNQRYGAGNLNTQYISPDPLDFGVDDDRHLVGTLPVAAPEIIHHEGRTYIAALMPSLKGIRIAELGWVD